MAAITRTRQWAFFTSLAVARVIAGLYANISDCDEVGGECGGWVVGGGGWWVVGVGGECGGATAAAAASSSTTLLGVGVVGAGWRVRWVRRWWWTMAQVWWSTL